MTLFGIPTIAWIVLLLCTVAAVAWILDQMRASRNWDFKERSLQYLKDKDVERKRSDIPTPTQLDRELAER